MYCKGYFILKSMLYNGNKKCITFLTTIEKAKQFEKCLNIISGLLNVKIDVWQLNCFTSKTKREEIYDSFKTSINLAMILNVHILDEGINLVECDSVYITQPNNDLNNLTQRMCRANRILPNKETCYVYLWCQQKKVDKLLDHIFDKTNGHFKDKIFKFSFFGDKIKIDKHVTKNMDKCSNTVQKNNDYLCSLEDYLQNLNNTNNRKIEVKSKFDVKDIDAAKYLGISLQSLRNRLLNQNSKNKNYIEKVDYIKTKSGTSNASLTYMINYQCFERLAVSGDSKKSKTIMTYFSKFREFKIDN